MLQDAVRAKDCPLYLLLNFWHVMFFQNTQIYKAGKPKGNGNYLLFVLSLFICVTSRPAAGSWRILTLTPFEGITLISVTFALARGALNAKNTLCASFTIWHEINLYW